MKNKTSIDMPLGDAIDRLTILLRKQAFGEDAAQPEADYIASAIDKLNIKMTGALLKAVVRIAYANFEVWNRENEFRRGGDNAPAEDVKRMMIEVRDFNRRRIVNKNELNMITGLGFKEFKIKHRSG